MTLPVSCLIRASPKPVLAGTLGRSSEEARLGTGGRATPGFGDPGGVPPGVKPASAGLDTGLDGCDSDTALDWYVYTVSAGRW